MKRSKFLVQLAVENKFAVVSDKGNIDVAIVPEELKDNGSVSENSSIYQEQILASSPLSNHGLDSTTSETFAYRIDHFYSDDDLRDEKSGLDRSASIGNPINKTKDKALAALPILPNRDLETQTENVLPGPSSENVVLEADVISENSVSAVTYHQVASNVLTAKETLNMLVSKYGGNDEKKSVSESNEDTKLQNEEHDCRSPGLPLQEKLIVSISSESTTYISDSESNDQSYIETFSGFNSDTVLENNKYANVSFDFEDSGSEYLPPYGADSDMPFEKEDYRVAKVQNTCPGLETKLFKSKEKGQSDLPNTEHIMEPYDNQSLTRSKISDERPSENNDLKQKKFNQHHENDSSFFKQAIVSENSSIYQDQILASSPLSNHGFNSTTLETFTYRIDPFYSDDNLQDQASGLDGSTSIEKPITIIQDKALVASPILPNCDLENQRKTVLPGSTSSENVVLEENNKYANDSFDFEDSGSEYLPSSGDELTSDFEMSFEKKEYKVGKVKNTYPGKKTKHFQSKEKGQSNLPNTENIMEPDDNQPSTSCKISNELPSENNGSKSQKFNDCHENDVSPVLEKNIGKNQKYTRKPSARERPIICPICYNDVITHFTRHLFRHHGDHKGVKAIKRLNPRSKERVSMVLSLRKQGYFHLNMEKNVLNPVRRSKLPNTEYFACPYCLGHYSKKLLHKHVKICINKPMNITRPGKNCLGTSQSVVASLMSKNNEFLQKSRIQKEVFSIMRADDISAVAKKDPLICLYGETLISKHKREQIATLISNKMREMARMLIVIRTIETDVIGLFDVLKPEMFQTLLAAAKTISGYDPDRKEFRAPSLALHMGTNLKTICDIAFKLILEGRQIPNISWTNKIEKKAQIKDLRKLVDGHWCNELSSLALKNLKERQWETSKQLPLTDDILALQKYLDNLSVDSYEKLNKKTDIKKNYKILTECVLALTIMFNRKRVGDVQFLKLETYIKGNQRLDQEAFTKNLTAVEKILCTNFKRVVTGGKGSKPVPILFSKQIQKYMNLLLEVRNTCNLVPKSNPYIFAAPGSHKWISGASVIRRFASKCGAKHPELLSSTRFRKHIATTLQLMTMEPQEMEQIATFMGHTEKTHAEFYRLPQDIYQTAKVAKVLMLLEKGRGNEFKGKNLNDIEVEDNTYISESSEDENTQEFFKNSMLEINDSKKNTTVTNGNNTFSEDTEQSNSNSNNNPQTINMSDFTTVTNWDTNSVSEAPKEDSCSEAGSTDSEEDFSGARKKKSKKVNTKSKVQCSKKPAGRGKWTDNEKRLVLSFFKKHVQKKIAPKKHECEEYVAKYQGRITVTDWVKIKTLVYNSYRVK